MNTDWRAVCPQCRRSSSFVEDGSACPFCGTCSNTVEKWLEHYFKVGWAISVVLLCMLTFLAIVINIGEASADEFNAVVTEQGSKVVIDHDDGSIEYRTYDSRNVQITGERNGKPYFDYKPIGVQKIEDIETGLYPLTKKYYDKSPD